jgi:D-alanine--poly(phosphoribitol) ligase subunit 1
MITLADTFLTVVSRFGDKTALRFHNGQTASFSELWLRARAYMEAFDRFDLSQDRPLAIFHGKSLDSYAAMVGALNMGVPYACLDPANPGQRQISMLEKLRPSLILADDPDNKVQERLHATIQTRGLDCPIINRRDISNEISARAPKRAIQSSDIAYIMFTSGSTGTPKGMAISHSNVLAFIDWAREAFGISSSDVLSGVNPPHFDNSVFDFYCALYNGACLAPVPRAQQDHPPNLINTLEAAKTTLVFAVPSFFIYLRAMRALTSDRLPDLRMLAFGGEGYPKTELRSLFESFGARATLLNVYGPTECTCICSIKMITDEDFANMDELAPIGPLAPICRGYVLDGEDEVADGEVGELCLVGSNVGLGYFRDREQTASAFVPNPRREAFEERMYRTGDYVRFHPENGHYSFVGRRDQQIKHMGHRIELGEIEAILTGNDIVSQAFIGYVKADANFGRIVAFVATGSNETSEDALVEYLRGRLPGYMIPHQIRLFSELPRNPNGKVDRLALMEEIR